VPQAGRPPGEALGDGITHEYLNGIPHGPGDQLWVEFLSHKERQAVGM